MIDNGKKLSIIIPYYETYELTKKILDVLIPQLTDEAELILIDDGCNEKRFDVYADKIIVEHNKENKGGATTSNIGIRKAKGKYIALIDSDDMVKEDYVETLIKAINERNEDVIFFDWQDMNTGNIVHHPSNYAPWKAIYKKEIIPFFRDGWIFSFDVPFQEDLAKIPHSKYYLDKVLYLYNSNRPGNLTSLKDKIRKGGDKMVKVEVIEDFTLERFNELKNIVRKTQSRNQDKYLYIGDVFECDMPMVDYLTKDNAKKRAFVKIIEVIPDEKEKNENIKVEKVEKKKISKKNIAKK